MSKQRKEILPADWDQDRWDRRRQYYTTDFYVIPEGGWTQENQWEKNFDSGRICGTWDEAIELADELLKYCTVVRIRTEHGIMKWVRNTDAHDPAHHFWEWDVLYYEDGGIWKHTSQMTECIEADLMPGHLGQNHAG